jgi:3-hydroxymyristoyl/3-hydroxydecanoyl-(acyl carrier protein) dehydratase
MRSDAESSRGIGHYLSSMMIEEKGEDSFRASGTIAEDCCILRGHFPGRPVLPGAFHVWIVLLLLGEVKGAQLRLLQIRKAKFRRLLMPRDTITIRCSYRPDGDDRITARCTIEKDGKEASRFTTVCTHSLGKLAGPARRAGHH